MAGYQFYKNFREAVNNSWLKGLDTLGRVDLSVNTGDLLPYNRLPEQVSDFIDENGRLTAERDIILDRDTKLKSQDYSPGREMGQGILISQEKSRLKNLYVEGYIETAIFKKDTVQTVGSNIMVSKGAGKFQKFYNDGSWHIITDEDTEFNVDDYIRIDGALTEWIKITADNGDYSDNQVESGIDYTVERDKEGVFGTPPLHSDGSTLTNFGTDGDGGVTIRGGNNQDVSIFKFNQSAYSLDEKSRFGNLLDYSSFDRYNGTEEIGFAVGDSAGDYITYDTTNGVLIKGDITLTDNIDNISLMGWNYSEDIVPGDYNSISISTGTIAFSNGDDYSINAHAINISGLEYIYYQKGDSEFTSTSTYSNAIGDNKVLVAIAKSVADTNKKAEIITFGGSGLFTPYVRAENIVADTITASEIAADTLTLGNMAFSDDDSYLDQSVLKVGGTATFLSGYDPSTKETPSGAQSKADAAENDAKSYTDTEIGNLGDLVDYDLVETAMEDETIISGGYIDTTYLTANNITAGTLDADKVTVINLDAGNINVGTLSVGYTEAKCTDANADETSSNTAAGIAGQGDLATKNKALVSNGDVGIDGSLEITGDIYSSDYSPGSDGWKIDGSADSAEFNDVTVRGKIIIDTDNSQIDWSKVEHIDALSIDHLKSGNFSGQTITGGTIQTGDSGQYVRIAAKDDLPDTIDFAYNDTVEGYLLADGPLLRIHALNKLLLESPSIVELKALKNYVVVNADLRLNYDVLDDNGETIISSEKDAIFNSLDITGTAQITDGNTYSFGGRLLRVGDSQSVIADFVSGDATNNWAMIDIQNDAGNTLRLGMFGTNSYGLCAGESSSPDLELDDSGNITIAGNIQTGGTYKSSDGTAGGTGINIGWRDAQDSIHNVDVKDGILVSWKIDGAEQLS